MQIQEKHILNDIVVYIENKILAEECNVSIDFQVGRLTLHESLLEYRDDFVFEKCGNLVPIK